MASSSSSSTSSTKKRNREYALVKEGLNEEQLLGFDLIVDKEKNVLITGQGGTGKSHLIKIVTEVLKEKYPRKVVVTATTGIAAIFIEGSTFHKWAKLGLMQESKED
jgi:DNA replication protein DnaC